MKQEDFARIIQDIPPPPIPLNYNAFLPSWIVDPIYGRDTEILKIHKWCTQIIHKNHIHSIIYGNHGLGKSYICRFIQTEYQKHKVPVYYLDCDNITPINALQQLCKYLGYSIVHPLQNLFSHTSPCIILVDNLDHCTSLTSLFTSCFEPLFQQHYFSFGFITSNPKRIIRKLNRYREYILELEKIRFSDYTPDDLQVILAQRVLAGNVSNIITSENIQFFCREITHICKSNCLLMFEIFIECIKTMSELRSPKLTPELIKKCLIDHQFSRFKYLPLEPTFEYDLILLQIFASLKLTKCREHDFYHIFIQIIAKKQLASKSESWVYKKILDMKEQGFIEMKREKNKQKRGTENIMYLLFNPNELRLYLEKFN